MPSVLAAADVGRADAHDDGSPTCAASRAPGSGSLPNGSSHGGRRPWRACLRRSSCAASRSCRRRRGRRALHRARPACRAAPRAPSRITAISSPIDSASSSSGRGIDDGHAELAVQPLQLRPHVVAQLGVEIGQRLVEQQDARLRESATRPSATRCCSPPESVPGLRSRRWASCSIAAVSLTRRCDLGRGDLCLAQRIGEILEHGQMRIEREATGTPSTRRGRRSARR